jgi:cytochrome c-type biogenesis protein CcmH/NrfF
MFLRLLVALFIITYTFETHAESTSLKDAQEIYYETLSPFCPGRSLADCPTDQSRELKVKILQDLESGKSKQEVLNKVLADYGQHLSAKPGLSGFNLFAWLIPLFFIGIGIIVVFFKFKTKGSEEE